MLKKRKFCFVIKKCYKIIIKSIIYEYVFLKFVKSLKM